MNEDVERKDDKFAEDDEDSEDDEDTEDVMEEEDDDEDDDEDEEDSDLDDEEEEEEEEECVEADFTGNTVLSEVMQNGKSTLLKELFSVTICFCFFRGTWQ